MKVTVVLQVDFCVHILHACSIQARSVADGILATVALMQDSRLPCFGRGAPIPNLRKRFHLDMTEAKAAAFMRSTILDAYDKVLAFGHSSKIKNMLVAYDASLQHCIISFEHVQLLALKLYWLVSAKTARAIMWIAWLTRLQHRELILIAILLIAVDNRSVRLHSVHAECHPQIRITVHVCPILC